MDNSLSNRSASFVFHCYIAYGIANDVVRRICFEDNRHNFYRKLDNLMKLIEYWVRGRSDVCACARCVQIFCSLLFRTIAAEHTVAHCRVCGRVVSVVDGDEVSN